MKPLQDRIWGTGGDSPYLFEGQKGTTQPSRIAGTLEPAWVGSENPVVAGRIAKLYMPTTGSNGGKAKGRVPLVFPYGESLTAAALKYMGWAVGDYDDPLLIMPTAPVSQVGPVTGQGVDINTEPNNPVGYPGRGGDQPLHRNGVEWLLSGDIVVKTTTACQLQGTIHVVTAGAEVDPDGTDDTGDEYTTYPGQFANAGGDELEGIEFRESGVANSLVIVSVLGPIRKKS